MAAQAVRQVAEGRRQERIEGTRGAIEAADLSAGRPGGPNPLGEVIQSGPFDFFAEAGAFNLVVA